MVGHRDLLACFGAALLVLAGCDAGGVLLGPGGADRLYEIDSSAIVDAELMTPYQARLLVRGYDGPVAWSVVGGGLPAGLGMQGNGTISGTPTWIGQASFEVRVTGMPGSDGLQADLAIRVGAGEADVRLGWAHDQTTNLSQTGLMQDLWVRIAGGGEDDSSSYTLDPGVYLAGSDGVHAWGGGDDVRVGDLLAGDVQIQAGTWHANQEWDHVPEGSPVVFDGALTFQAGADTGEMSLTIASDYGTATTRVIAVPPDWCPQGVDGFDGWCL